MLLEVALAISILAATATGGLFLMERQERAIRNEADRAVALGAASSLLERLRTFPPPVDGEHPFPPPRLPEGSACVVVDHEPPGGPGIARLTAEIRWRGLDGKSRSLALSALQEAR